MRGNTRLGHRRHNRGLTGLSHDTSWPLFHITPLTFTFSNILLSPWAPWHNLLCVYFSPAPLVWYPISPKSYSPKSPDLLVCDTVCSGIISPLLACWFLLFDLEDKDGEFFPKLLPDCTVSHSTRWSLPRELQMQRIRPHLLFLISSRTIIYSESVMWLAGCVAWCSSIPSSPGLLLKC
jgi:hypothetical protein